jgi:hypothetical protein
MLDQAIAALQAYDWGGDLAALQPIDDAVVTTHEDAAARAELETQLLTVLQGNASRAAKDFACRKLAIVGTAAAVPTLSALLPEAENSHMARYALERIPGAESAQALRDALPTLSESLQIGAISSLGVRGEATSIDALYPLLGSAEPVARAAAMALGDIRTEEASVALASTKPAGAAAQLAATDASLACAEALLAGGKAAEALSIYKRFAGEEQPKHIRLAATRGMLACAGKAQ